MVEKVALVKVPSFVRLDITLESRPLSLSLCLVTTLYVIGITSLTLKDLKSAAVATDRDGYATTDGRAELILILI